MMRNEIAALQDLRGVAILIVICFHTGQLFNYYVTNNGTTGVMLFFSISGFIIACIHKDDAGFSRLIVFAKKRIARIYPPYLPVFFCFLAILLIAGAGSDYHRNVINIIRNIILVQDPNFSIHPYAWSLVYEVYYYFMFGIIIILLRAPLYVFCLTIAIPSLFAIYAGISSSDDGFSLLYSPCNLYFCFGVAYSTLGYRSGLKMSPMLSYLFLAGVILYPLLPQYELIRFIMIVGLFISYNGTPRSSKFLYTVGTASYSIYLTHALILPILKQFSVHQNVIVFILIISICISVGLLYHQLIEIRLVRIAGSTIRL